MNEMLDRMAAKKIKITGIERVLGPYVANAHSFVYSDGYPLRKGSRFYVIYKQSKEQVFVDKKMKILLSRDNDWNTNYGRYVNSASNVKREIYLKPYRVVLTKKMIEEGVISRHFAKSKLGIDKDIFEISPDFVGSDATFYDIITLSWQITGDKEMVSKYNIESLEKAEEKVEGMRYFLNPLEFYNEEPTLESKKQSLLERLLHNPHTYGHQSQASNVGSALGLTGTHTMPDGSVMPGSTHQEYLNALRRNQEITTSSGTTIPTQNLRRNSGY